MFIGCQDVANAKSTIPHQCRVLQIEGTSKQKVLQRRVMLSKPIRRETARTKQNGCGYSLRCYEMNEVRCYEMNEVRCYEMNEDITGIFELK
jgi:hypothetical protein